MGRWVTSKGRRIYIPDEGEENPYQSKKENKEAEESPSESDYILSKNSEGQELKVPRKTYEDRLRRAEEHQKSLQGKRGTYPEDHKRAKEQVESLREALKSGKTSDYDKYAPKNQIDKEQSTKEKQISQNKAQADERNGKDWENGYHIEHTDSVGGKFVDKGKVGDYKIGEKVNYLSNGKLKPGTINKVHIYPNGKVDYNVVDKNGDGHNISSNNLAKTDANRTKQDRKKKRK